MNNTENYHFVIKKISEDFIFSIEQKNLLYVDFGNYLYGMQCLHDVSTEEYKKIKELCNKAINIVKEIHKLNSKEK